MKQLILTVFVLVPLLSLGQKNPDYCVTEKGDTIKLKQWIKIGLGTKPDGTYKFVTGFISPTAGYSGAKMEVRKIVRVGNEKSGFRYILKIHPGVGMVNYDVDLENALKVGEIEIIKD